MKLLLKQLLDVNLRVEICRNETWAYAQDLELGFAAEWLQWHLTLANAWANL